MARLIANANGNFTASVWGLVDSASESDSEAVSTALTASDQNSSTFTPAAVALDGVAVKVSNRATGSPSNTITITLRNNTTATDITSVTINVSDIQTCDSTSNDGGWYFFKFSSTHTPNGTDTYVIRARLSATTTAVSLWATATTNWSRLLRTTTTQAPAAADKMVITKEWTAAATGTARSITMNNTAATVFGASGSLSTSNWAHAAMAIGNGGTLTWGNTAATNYLLTLVGSLVVYAGGTYVCGGSGSEIPRDSTAILEFQPATSGDSRFGCLNLSNVSVRGLSRTIANNSVWCLLNTDEAAGQTTLGVDTDTGWLSGDSIAIASTSRTNTESELRVLNGNAGASSLAITVALTNAHKGSVSDEIQAEIILLTRNVIIRTNNAARFTIVIVQATSTCFFSWIYCQYHGFSTTPNNCNTTTGSVTWEYCAFQDFSSNGAITASVAAANNFTINHCVGYGTANGCNFITIAVTTGTNWTINDCVCVRAGNATIFSISDLGGTITNLRGAGCGSTGMTLSDAAGITGTLNNIVIHSGAGVGIGFTNVGWQNKTISNFLVYRNSGIGITFSNSNTIAFHQAIFDTLTAFGNVTTNIQITSHFGKLTGKNWVIAGDTSFSTVTGLDLASTTGGTGWLYLLGGTFGGGGGTKTTHTTRDINITTNFGITWLDMVNTSLVSATEITGETGPLQGSRYSIQNPDGAIANSRTYYTKVGSITYETSVVHGTVSEKLTPIETSGSYLYSSPKRVAVNNADTVTMTVWARKSAAYNGSIQPRMIVRANPALGIDDDTVLDTLSVAADTWEQLSGTTAAVSGKGVLEFCLQVNGTAGLAYADTWEAS
jgi:hypothetical protein